jgi:GTP pyrophosphokinase
MVAVRDIHLKDNFTLDEWVSSLTLSESDKNQLRTVYQYCLTLGDEALTNRLLVRGVEMVGILLMLSMDLATLKAAILYPFVEAGLISQEKVNEDFGPKIAKLVEGVLEMEAIRSCKPFTAAKPRRSRWTTCAACCSPWSRTCAPWSSSWRSASPACVRRRADEETRVLMAQEITNIYAPLANRLGIGQLKWELEDLAFRYLHPDTYKQIAKQLTRSGSIASATSANSCSPCAMPWPRPGSRPRSTAGRNTSTASGARCRRSTSNSTSCSMCARCG